MKIQKQRWILTGLLVAIAMVFSACGRSSGSGIIQERRGSGARAAEAKEQVLEVEEVASTEEEAFPDLYILTKIDTEQKLAVFEKVSSGRQSQYAYHTGTMFLDKYGDTKSIVSFVPGDVVEIEVSSHTQQLSQVQLSDAVWVYEDITNYSIDESIHALTIGQTRYAYSPGMEIFSGDDRIGFEDIGQYDVLRAVVMDKKLLSLAVEVGHGYLALANTEIFEGSFICIGDRIFEEVAKNMQIEAPEGKHLVTVANQGYGGSREVEIIRGQTTSLNLDELKGEGPKICKITFQVGVEGASLWIDGEKADYSKPVEVRYGVHTVAVEAEGYDTITEKLVVNSPKAEIEIALTSQKSSSEKSKDTDNNGNNNNNANNNNNNGNNNNNNGNANNNNNNGNANNNNNNGNANNNNNNGNANNNNNQPSTDYLTTLYNLLTSINNNGSSSNAGGGSNTNSGYDDLRDE